jgi:hypothetical protein
MGDAPVVSHGILRHSPLFVSVCSKVLFLAFVSGGQNREWDGGDLGEEVARAVCECQVLLVGFAIRNSVGATHRFVFTPCLHLAPKWPLLSESPTGDI